MVQAPPMHQHQMEGHMKNYGGMPQMDGPMKMFGGMQQGPMTHRHLQGPHFLAMQQQAAAQVTACIRVLSLLCILLRGEKLGV